MSDFVPNEYRFRYECQADLANLILAAHKHEAVDYFKLLEVKDAEVLIETSLTLAAVRELMDQVEDGHIMNQTVNFAERYTGSRNIDGHRASQPEEED